MEHDCVLALGLTALSAACLTKLNREMNATSADNFKDFNPTLVSLWLFKKNTYTVYIYTVYTYIHTYIFYHLSRSVSRGYSRYIYFFPGKRKYPDIHDIRKAYCDICSIDIISSHHWTLNVMHVCTSTVHQKAVRKCYPASTHVFCLNIWWLIEIKKNQQQMDFRHNSVHVSQQCTEHASLTLTQGSNWDPGVVCVCGGELQYCPHLCFLTSSNIFE